MRVPACQCRLPEQERAAEERCCTLHRAGLKDSGREERSPPGMQRCWGSRRPHPLGSAPRSPLLPVIPGVFPKATLASLLFSGQPWVLLQHRLRRGGRCGRGGGTGKGEKRRGSGQQGPSLWAPSPSVRWGSCAQRHLSPGHSKGTLPLHCLPPELRWLLGKWSVF